MDPSQPTGTIRPQPLTSAAFTPDATLVDDTAALVDDTTALSGGTVTPIRTIRVAVQPSSGIGTVSIRR